MFIKLLYANVNVVQFMIIIIYIYVCVYLCTCVCVHAYICMCSYITKHCVEGIHISYMVKLVSIIIIMLPIKANIVVLSELQYCNGFW